MIMLCAVFNCSGTFFFFFNLFHCYNIVIDDNLTHRVTRLMAGSVH